MAVTAADLQALPGLSSLSDADANEALDEARLQVNVGVWGTKHDQGVKLLAAHIALSTQNLATTLGGGPIEREKVGLVEREYATPKTSDAGSDDLMTTVYGTRYSSLRRTVAGNRGPVAAV